MLSFASKNSLSLTAKRTRNAKEMARQTGEYGSDVIPVRVDLQLTLQGFYCSFRQLPKKLCSFFSIQEYTAIPAFLYFLYSRRPYAGGCGDGIDDNNMPSFRLQSSEYVQDTLDNFLRKYFDTVLCAAQTPVLVLTVYVTYFESIDRIPHGHLPHNDLDLNKSKHQHVIPEYSGDQILSGCA